MEATDMSRSSPRPIRRVARAAHRFRVVLCSAFLIATACNDGPTTPPGPTPTALEAVSTRESTGGSNQPLADSIVVRVLDQDGAPLPGVSVTFTVRDGGGTISPAKIASDVNGLAATEWMLGQAGPQSLMAAVDEAAVGAVEFQAVAVDTRGQARVDSEGGEISTESGARLSVPAGALSGREVILIELEQDVEPQPGLVAGTTYDFSPDGLTFETPVTVEIPYDPSMVQGALEELSVFRRDTDGSWTQLPSAVDEDARVVRAETEHFSVYALRTRPFADVEAATDTISSRLGRRQKARYDVLAKLASPIATASYRVNGDAETQLPVSGTDSIVDLGFSISTSRLKNQARNQIDFAITGTDGLVFRFSRNLWLMGPEGSSTVRFTAPSPNAIIEEYPFEVTVHASDSKGIVAISLFRDSEPLGIRTFANSPDEVTATFKLPAMGNGRVTLRAEAHSLNNYYRASGSASVSFSTREFDQE